jgi:hypothetical protein
MLELFEYVRLLLTLVKVGSDAFEGFPFIALLKPSKLMLLKGL